MVATFNPHPYQIAFFYPYNATLATATASITMKAPEYGDKRTKGRNQTFSRVKNGNVIVYDMGTTMADILSLSFELVPLAEYASMLVFFDYVTWGANKIAYVDYKGDTYIVRIYKNTVEATNKGESRFNVNELTMYNFTLDLIDVTNNVADSGQTAVPTQLALHLADYVHPHNPKTTTLINSATPAVVESILVDSIKHVTWLCNIFSGTFSKTVFISATHDGTPTTDAANVGSPGPITQDVVGTDPGDISFSVVLNGTGLTQAIQLKCAKTTGSATLVTRRVLL